MDNIQIISNPLDFNQIYKQYYKEIVSFVGFKIQDSMIAEEVVNDSFMKLYNNLSTFDAKKASIKNWLFTIVNNTVIDYYRKVKKEHLKTSIDNSIEGKRVYEINSNEPNALNVMFGNELENNIIKYIKKFRNNDMKVIAKLYFIDDLSYEEISNELEIPLGSVKGFIHRIRIELQSSLRKKEVYI